VKLLIDECLSEELAHLALERGHVETSHVVWIGKGGFKDWNLLPVILDGDWTFVTRNAHDFRGSPDEPGRGGEYAKAEIHAGLICLNDLVMDLDVQRELFEVALDELERDGDLVNQVLEVETVGESEIRIRRYTFPTG
jgi:hypothetical protein